MNLTVVNNGYLTIAKVREMYEKYPPMGKKFAIYKTNKKTVVLVEDYNHEHIYMYRPDYGRVPYNNVEGKKIAFGTKIFDSTTDNFDKIDTSLWNGGKQIMSYYPFTIC